RIKTSGRCRRTAATVSSPFTHPATTWKSGSRWNKLSSPLRTIGWSSARTRRMGGDISGSSSGGGEPDLEASAGGAGVDRQRAAEGVDPLLEDDRSELERAQGRVVVVPMDGEAGSVVGDDALQLPFPPAHGDPP